MKFPSVYNLSNAFGPPNIDLRKGRIIDDYGSDDYAMLPTKHSHPSDVTREQLNYYQDVYSFIGIRDLIFYLYPVFREYDLDYRVQFIDSYMFTLDRKIQKLAEILNIDQTLALRTGLAWFEAIDLELDQRWHTFKNLLSFYERTHPHRVV